MILNGIEVTKGFNINDKEIAEPVTCTSKGIVIRNI